MFDIAGIVIMKVLKVLFNTLFLLNRYSTLAILKDLIIVVYAPICNDDKWLARMPSKVTITIIASKTFQPSWKYLLPKPTYFKMNSEVNIPANI